MFSYKLLELSYGSDVSIMLQLTFSKVGLDQSTLPLPVVFHHISNGSTISR